VDDLQAYAVHLRSLGELSPTSARRAEVTEALHHKWEGIQSIAAQVLGRWAGHESIEALRTWLFACFERKNGWAVRGVAVQQLAQLVEARDTEWVLELYFGLEDRLAKHEILPLVLALRPESAREGLVSRLRDPDWANRQAAVKAIGNMAFPDRRQLLSPLVDDAHKEVQKSARYLTQNA
jgi:HEAT repeat protein